MKRLALPKGDGATERMIEMAYLFFYISMILSITALIICTQFRRPHLPNILIGALTIAYSISSEVIIGDQLKLFHYINPEQSNLFMLLASLGIYVPLNIIFTMFLPLRTSSVLIYTFLWITGMLVFEYFSVLTGSIVFTGWVMIPWSIILYLIAYTWIILAYRYFLRRMGPHEASFSMHI